MLIKRDLFDHHRILCPYYIHNEVKVRLKLSYTWLHISYLLIHKIVSITCDAKGKSIYLQFQLYCTTKLLLAMALGYSTPSLSFKNLYNTKIQQNSILVQVNATIYSFIFLPSWQPVLVIWPSSGHLDYGNM